MSETAETSPGRFILLWMLHQSIAFFGGLAIVFVLEKSQLVRAAVWLELALMFVGQFFLGYSMPRTPSHVRAALWVWFLPTLAFGGVFLWNCYDFGLARTMADYFAVDGIGDNPKAATAIFTVPTGWAVVYSLGASVRKWPPFHR
jgi:hypothetical protein